jgi:hypothetical protein
MQGRDRSDKVPLWGKAVNEVRKTALAEGRKEACRGLERNLFLTRCSTPEAGCDGVLLLAIWPP